MVKKVNKTSRKAVKASAKKVQKMNMNKTVPLTRTVKSQFARTSVAQAYSGSRASYFNMAAGSKPGSCRIKGQDLLSTVNIPAASYTVAQNLVNTYINPLYFSGTRLERFGQMYDKFLFRNLKFHYVPACPTTTPGNVLIAYDRDFADSTPTADDVGLRQYFAMMNTKVASIWESFSIDCQLTDLQDFYYTNNTGFEGRLVYQGQVYVSIGASFTLSTSTSALLWVEYDIELFDPQLDISNSSVSDVNATSITTDATANAGWNVIAPGTAQKVTGAAKIGTGVYPGSPTNVAVSLPGGTYLVEQLLNGASGATSNWLPPTLSPKNLLETMSQANVFSYGGTSGAIGRVDKVKVPASGGYLLGNYGLSGVTATKGSLYVTPTPTDSYGVIL